MALEAPADRIRQVYLSASFYEQYKIPEKLAEVPVEIVEDRVFAQMSDTKTPQGILCLVKQYHYDREEILGKTKPLLLYWRICWIPAMWALFSARRREPGRTALFWAAAVWISIIQRRSVPPWDLFTGCRFSMRMILQKPSRS